MLFKIFIIYSKLIFFFFFFAANAAAAGYVGPYAAYALPGGGAMTAATAAGATFPGLPYQSSPQEARLQ